jgi:hypothetical protein
MDSAKVTAAVRSVENARKLLDTAIAKWDETVTETQLAWLAVRRAQRHLRDAVTIAQHEVGGQSGE